MVLSILLTLACLSCTDNNPHLPDDATGPALEMSAVLRCTVDVGSAVLSCTEEGPTGANGASLALLGNASVKLRSANNSYDSLSLVYGFDVTVQNLLSYNIGTPDGQTRAGLKVFFQRVPYVTVYKSTGDTGTVAVTNYDGTQNFTAANQPYFLYDTILPPQAVTNAKRWEFRVPRTVQNFGFAVVVFTATTRENRVSVTPPDNIPARYKSQASYRWCDISGLGECVYDAIMLRFRPGTPQEERQSAVDLVGGVVEGGIAAMGIYLVRIPRDTTLVKLRNALTSLRSLPQVAYAYPYGEIEVEGSYRRPDDGPDWEDWRLVDSLWNGRKWSLEVISAPYAWGCETGSSSAPVAIVDSDFHLVTDLLANATARDTLVGHLTAAVDSADHGTFTASVFGAVGNNNAEMTGLMWQANMRLYEVADVDSTGAIWRTPDGRARTTALRMATQVARAARDGASVINLSMGISWTATAKSRGWIPPTATSYNPATETDSARKAVRDEMIEQLRQLMVGAIDETAVVGFHPLVVIAAGNDGIDARWSGYANAVADRPNNFLIVGAGARNTGSAHLSPASFTNYGSLVEIAAPGVNVTGLNRNGQKLWHGTSFAAPLVAATAGLLLSFDPRLEQHPDTLKALILAGADAGMRRMQNGASATDTIPVVNVYEALKAAARRAGAPLCGNRLWVANGNFYAQRDTASPAGEELFPAPASSRSGTVAFNALHGGKDVMFYTRPTFTGRRWSASGWTTIPYSDQGLNNASFLSRAGQSHNQDTTVVLEREGGPRTTTWRPVVRTAGSEVRLANVITDSVYDDPGLCLARFVEVPAAWHSDYVNHDSAKVRESYLEWRQSRGFAGNCMSVGRPRATAETFQFLAYAPVGQQAYVFMVRRRSTTRPTGSRTCTLSENINHMIVFYTAECIDAVTVNASAGTAAYRINVRDGAIVPLSWSEPSLELWSPMIREDGREIVVERQNYRATIVESWYEVHEGGVSYRGSTNTATGECILQFRDLQSGTVKLSPGTCFGSSGGQGGMSAVRSPGS